MSRTRWFLPFVALALAACSADQKVIAPTASASRALHSASAAGSGRYVISATSGFSTDFASAVAARGGSIESLHAGAGVAVVSGLTDATARQMIGKGGVDDVQPDVEFTLDEPVASIEADVSAVGDPVINSQANPTTALRYSWQWNMRQIQADGAWALGKLGSPSVTVAILDSGIDYDAPDLIGLVDLSRSTSFVPSDDAITTTYFPTRHRISDYNGHGTNVATQVSSKAFALAGVTSRTTLIGVKVLGRTGSGTSSGVLNGLLYAADSGADVANMSLGSSFAKKANKDFIKVVNQVLNYVKRKGMVVVVSAGNDASDLDHNGDVFSSYCDAKHVICVSAVGPALGSQIGTAAADAPAYYTNFGRKAIDVAAPGGNADAAHNFTVSAWPWGNDIASWVWSYCSKTRIAGLTTAGVPILTACVAGNRLTGYIGTSQAAPHVAGLAALIVADQGHGKPEQIKQEIEHSADDIGPRGQDEFSSRGRINVLRAVSGH